MTDLRETDKLVAIAINFCGPNPNELVMEAVPRYSEDPAAALAALEEWMNRMEVNVRIEVVPPKSDVQWSAQVEAPREGPWFCAPTLPLAICRLIAGTKRRDR